MLTGVGQPTWLRVTLCGGGVQEGTMLLAQLSADFQLFPPLPTIKLGPFGADSPGGWACICSRTLWVSSTNSPVRLGVSPTAASTPTGVFSQRLEALFPPHWNSGFRGLSCSPVVPPGLSAHECGITQSASHPLPGSSSCRLAVSPLCPAACLCPSYRSG